MVRLVALVFCSAIAIGQVRQEDPFDAANQAYSQARQKGQFDVAAAQREEMNRLLQALAPGEVQFAGRAQNVAQLYDSDGLSATGRAVLEGALARAEGAGATGEARAALLMSLANFWERDRNLLKCLAFMEKAVAVSEQTPKAEQTGQRVEGAAGLATPAGSLNWNGVVYGSRAVVGNARQAFVALRGLDSPLSVVGGLSAPFRLQFAATIDRVSVYSQLADLYQRLGRRDQAAAVLAKMKALPEQRNNWNLAQYYEQHDEPEQAAAIYKERLEEMAADPQSDPLQMSYPARALATLYERQKRPDDAAAVLRQAIAAIEAPGKPELAAQTVQLRQRLATLLYQGGRTEAADRVFQPPAEDGPSGAWLTIDYANYLGGTKRAAQGETLLANYLTDHPNLDPGEQGNILISLGNLARTAGDSTRAEEYSREASQKLASKDPQPEAVGIEPALRKAQSEAGTGNIAEAFTLVTQAMARSGSAPDRDAIARMGPGLANSFSVTAPMQADQLYRNVSELTQSWSANTMQPWLIVLEGYPRFLMSQQRSGEVLPAIDRYRTALRTARGADTGWLEEPLRLTIDLERGRNSPQAAIPVAQDLLGLEERLDGSTSEPYYRAAETLAELYRTVGDSARALPLYQQAVAIADAVFRADDVRRVQARRNSAALLVAERRLDEAEQLVREAIGIRKTTPPGRADGLALLLEQIHGMQKAR
ncbi:MAG TPA: tetratricopeptide repeat protein [Bryobacteraceae bacterium]|nr:tetratricopeptide repeat protein [Bryobacteraceae bacterium]